MSRSELEVTFQNLPDKVSEMEAYWHVIMLSHGICMVRCYRELLFDEKAAYNIIKANEFIERSIRRAYGKNEAQYLIDLANEKANQGFDRQKEIERCQSAESANTFNSVESTTDSAS